MSNQDGKCKKNNPYLLTRAPFRHRGEKKISSKMSPNSREVFFFYYFNLVFDSILGQRERETERETKWIIKKQFNRIPFIPLLAIRQPSALLQGNTGLVAHHRWLLLIRVFGIAPQESRNFSSARSLKCERRDLQGHCQKPHRGQPWLVCILKLMDNLRPLKLHLFKKCVTDKSLEKNGKYSLLSLTLFGH